MGSEWASVPFEKVLSIPLRNGLTRPKRVRGEGVKMVNMGELFAHSRISNVDMARVPLSDSEAPKYLLEYGDLLFARQSLVLSGAGKCSIFLDTEEPTTFEGHLIRARVDLDKADPHFYYYFFGSPSGLQAVGSIVEQVAAAGIRGSDLSRLMVPYPPLPEQRAIAHILGALDDKIELNRQMNATLEAIARALFKSWFVDFDPVRAKCRGEPERWGEPACSPSVCSLFPDEFVDSELGEIPKGWKIWNIADIGEVVCGKTPSTKVPEYYGNDVPFIRIPDMHGKVFATETQKMLSFAGAASQEKQTIPTGSICVSCIATPGLVVITTQESQTNQQINSVMPRLPNETYFWYWSLLGLRDEIMASGSGGSVVTNLSTGRFSQLKVLSAPTDLRQRYNTSVQPIFERILANERESRTLAALRDTLLPKLISGELRVPDAERLVGRYG